MPLLLSLAGTAIGPGDILRLSENYDTGPGTGPVDLMVYNPRDSDVGLGLIVTSGYKAGLVLNIFPRDSNHAKGGLSVDWLIANWDDWFVFTYASDHRIKIEEARILFKEARGMPQET
jgi:hypothetical protein